MTIPKFDQLSGSESLSELIEMVAKLQKQVQWLMDGKIASDNVREIGGWNVSNTELASKDGDVGMSTEDTESNDIRFWAGMAVKGVAPWRVHKNGKMTATGATIQSQSGYPRVEIDPDNNLLGIYKDAQHWLKVNANDSGAGVPSLQFFDQINGRSAYVYFNGDAPILLIQSSAGNIQITAGDNVSINGTKVLINGIDILDTKADKSSVTKNVYVADSAGAPANTIMTIMNGIVVS